MPDWPNYDFPGRKDSQTEEESLSRLQRILAFLDDKKSFIGDVWRSGLDVLKIMMGAFLGALLSVSFSNTSAMEQAAIDEFRPVVYWILFLLLVTLIMMRYVAFSYSKDWDAIYEELGP